MNDDDKLPLCGGCGDDYYNRDGHSTTGRCWMLPKAKVVTRYRLGWWTRPTEPGAYTKVVTLDCHRATGQYALHEQPSQHAVDRDSLLAEEAYDPRPAMQEGGANA